MNLDINESELRLKTSPGTDRKPQNQTSRTKLVHRTIKRTWSNLKWLSRSIRIFLFDVILIEGKEKHSGLSIKTIYIGESEAPTFKLGKFYFNSEALDKNDNFKFFMDSIYSDYTILAQTKNINGLSISQELKKCEAQADMVFIDTELLFIYLLERERYLALPQGVSFRLMIPNRWEDVIKSFPKKLQKELRRILKHGYQHYVASTDNHLNYFYHAMYVPYTQTRFGDTAAIISQEKVNKILEQGEILLLFRNNNILLGSLNKFENESLLICFAASANNIQPEMFKGAAEAMDYFCILSAFEHGCNVVDFLYSRPFLDNGAFRYKRKWGAHVYKLDRPMTDIYFRPINLNPAVKSYLSRNPLIIKTPEGFRGRILIDTVVSFKDIQNCVNRYQTKGINGIDIFCTDPISETDIVYDGQDNKIYDISKSSHPAYEFCKPRS